MILSFIYCYYMFFIISVQKYNFSVNYTNNLLLFFVFYMFFLINRGDSGYLPCVLGAVPHLLR